MKKNILALLIVTISFVLLPHAAFSQANCPVCNIPNANYVFNNGNIISNQSFSNDIIEINGTVYIDGTCVFDRCEFYLSEQARIELMPGPTELFLHSNEFFNCCPLYMWDGIYTTDQDNYIFARNNYFRHGENVIVEAFGAEVILNSNEFDRCFYPLTLRDWSGSPRIAFRGNYIQSINPITAAPIPGSGKTEVGVRAINYVSIGGNILTIGDASAPAFTNSFEEIDTAISSKNSDVRIMNNYVSRTNEGICFVNFTPGILTCEIGGIGANQSNTLIDVINKGIFVKGRGELLIEGNRIEGGSVRGIELLQFISPTATARIWYNEIILGKHNSGGGPIYFEAIYVTTFRGDLSIRDNTIETKLHNGVELAIGRAIHVGWTYDMNTLEISDNIISNTINGILAYHIQVDYAYIESNNISFTTSAQDYGDYGIHSYNNTIDRKLNINYNSLENYKKSIYADHQDYCEINYNTILISALPANPYHILIGIYLSNSGSHSINNNHIEMSNGLNTSSANVYNFNGLILWDTYNTTNIFRNNVLHSERGLWILNDAYPSFIACNVFDYSLTGVYLSNAWHGIDYGGGIYEVGIMDYPNNNRWYNELHSQGFRIRGTVQTPFGNNTKWWYKTGTPFTLQAGQHQVTPSLAFQTFLTNELYDLCSAKSSSSNILTIGNLSEQDFMSLSGAKKDTLLMMEFHHLDSLVNYSPNLSSFILPNNVRGYVKVRHSYTIMMKHPWVLSGNVSATGNKYNAIKNFIAGTNIHSLFVIDTLAGEMYLPQFNSALAAFVPQNQVEQNAATYYTILKNYLSQQLVLSTADSVALLSVALQNANTGGFPVFKARSMLGLSLIDTLGQISSGNASLKHMNTSRPEENPESNIHVYPNPASELIFVETEVMEIQSMCFIEIYSYTGKLMSRTAVNNNSITGVPVKQLDKGFYFFRIVDQSKTLKSGKLIIQ